MSAPCAILVLNVYSRYPCGICVKLRNVAGLFRKDDDDLPQWLHLIQDLFVLMTVDSPSGMFKQEFPFTINTFFRGRIMSQKKSLKNRAIGILSSVKCSLSTWGYKFASLTLDNTEQYCKTKEGSKTWHYSSHHRPQLDSYVISVNCS